MLLKRQNKRTWDLKCDSCGSEYTKVCSPSRVLRARSHACSKECEQKLFRANTYRAGKKKSNRTEVSAVHRQNGETWIPLSQRLWTVINTDNWDLVKVHTWCASRHHNTFYAVSRQRINGRRAQLYMHKLLKSDGAVDHLDGNGLNNRDENLRYASKAQNARNSQTRSDSHSGIRGVTWIEANQKWRARITEAGQTKYLGYFNTVEEAEQARIAAENNVDAEFYKSSRVRSR